MNLIDLKKYLNQLVSEISEGEDPETLKQLKQLILINKLNIDLDLVEVKETKRIGDNGVFAKTDITKGQLITLYPVDTYENLTDNQNNQDNQIEHYKNYILKISLHNIISGNPNIYSSSYCGHMCNDGAKYIHSDDDDENDKRGSVYEKISKLKQNADIVILNEMVPCIIATKNINSGDEILLHYGVNRWKNMT